MTKTGVPLDLVVSVCVARDIRTWRVAAQAQVENLRAARRVVIVPDAELNLFREASPASISVEPESDYACSFLDSLRDALERAGNQDRFGWYLQQFLKLEAVRRMGKNELGAIWDADTVLLSPLEFFSDDGVPRFFSGDEYHLPYFQMIERALGLDKAVTQSFIAQCLPVSGDWLKAFFAAIEQPGMPWYETLIQATDFSETSGLSEYETLGTFYASTKGGQCEWQPGKWERRGATIFASPEAAIASPRRAQDMGLRFVAFEHWGSAPVPDVEHNLRGRLKRWAARSRASDVVRCLLRLPSRGSFHRLKGRTASEFLNRIFAREETLRVVQLGACDGEANDPLRRFLRERGNYSADLYEPIPEYFLRLSALYAERDDVRLHNVAVFDGQNPLRLHYIPPEVAERMDGDGPQNLWAYGQGSLSRAMFVYWIYRNAFRGNEYVRQIPDWISSIKSLSARTVPVARVIPSEAMNCLLVLDVQGAEEAILSSLSGNLPEWIYVETDRGSQQTHRRLTELGYVREISGSDSCYSLSGMEVMNVGRKR